MEDKYSKPQIEYIASLISRKIQNFFLSSPEFMFLAKILLVVILLFAIFVFLKFSF